MAVAGVLERLRIRSAGGIARIPGRVRELAIASAQFAVRRTLAVARTHYLLDWEAIEAGPCDGYSAGDLAAIDEEVAAPAQVLTAQAVEALGFPVPDFEARAVQPRSAAPTEGSSTGGASGAPPAS